MIIALIPRNIHVFMTRLAADAVSRSSEESEPETSNRPITENFRVTGTSWVTDKCIHYGAE